MRSAVFTNFMIIVKVDERLVGTRRRLIWITLFSFAVLGFMVRLNERARE